MYVGICYIRICYIWIMDMLYREGICYIGIMDMLYRDMLYKDNFDNIYVCFTDETFRWVETSK